MKVGISIIITIIVLVSIFPISAGTDNLIYENYSSPHPLKAYPARVIPHIDGKISPGEWNDTAVYRFIRYFRDGYMGPQQESIVELALKYDSDNMYIFFKIDDEKDEGGIYGTDPLLMKGMDVVTLILGSADSVPPTDVIGVLINYTDLAKNLTAGGRPDVAALFNNSLKNATLGSWDVSVYLNSSVDGSALSTYDNGSYVFEISLSLSYFNISENYAPFNIQFSDRGDLSMGTASIGTIGSNTPGIVFSSLYYPLPLLNIYHNSSLSNVTLSWNSGSNEDIEKYEILVSRNPLFKENYTTRIAILDRNTTSYDIANLSNGKYYFRIVSYTSEGLYGESNRVETTINLQPSSPPANLSLSLLASQVKLSWTPPYDNGNSSITGYKIYRGTSNDSLEVMATVNGSVTEYLDDNVTAGEKYYYAVSAVNSFAESNLSEISSIDVQQESQSVPSLALVGTIGSAVMAVLIASVIWVKYRRRK